MAEINLDEPFWIHLDVWLPTGGKVLYKTSLSEWQTMSEEERQQELYDAAMELDWFAGDFEYKETGRSDDD